MNWKLITIGILIIGITSCQTEKPIEKIRIKIIMEESFEGYGYQDNLREIYNNYFSV